MPRQWATPCGLPPTHLPTSATLTARALNRALLARQMLLARERTTAPSAIARLMGMQAQLARPPFVGLWTRLQDFRRAELLEAVHARTVVRVTGIRATLHLMSAADYVALRPTFQAGLERSMQGILRQRTAALDLDAVEAEARAFFGRAPATFDALRDHFARKYPEADERAMAYAIRTRLPLVQVPTGATWGYPAAADFALADRWLSRNIPRVAANPHELVLRYLAAFGPATPMDAQVWSGLSGLRAIFDEMRPQLVTFRDARKRELFDLPGAPRPDDDVPAPVRFVPEFDNLLLAHDDRTRVIADAHRPRVTLKNLQVRATFLVDGIVAGTWKTERKRRAAVLVIEPFGAVPKRTRAALEEEGDALLAFSDEDAGSREIRWSGG